MSTSGSVRIVRSCFLDVTTILSLLCLLFSVECISVLSQRVTGSSKLKNNRETTTTESGLIWQ